MHLRLLISFIRAAAVIAFLTASPAVTRAQTRTWTSPNPGNLLTNSNWSSGSAPNAEGATAVFDTNPTDFSGYFTLDGTMTLGTLTYNNSGGRWIDGTGSLILDATSGNALFHATSNSGYLDLYVPEVVLGSSTEFRIEGGMELWIYSRIYNGSGFGDYELIKTGSQSLYLRSTNNSYRGNTTITGGTLRGDFIADADENSSFGAGGGFNIFNGATLDLNTGLAASTNRSFTFGAGGGAIANYNELTISGLVNGAGVLTKQGYGTLILTGNNTYSGSTNITEGIVRGGTIANSGTNSAFGRGNFLISNGATLDYTGPNASTNRSIALGSGGGVISVSRVVASTVLTMSGEISGTGSLTKSGIRGLELSGNNSYEGGTIIAGGTLHGSAIADFGVNSPFGRGNFTITTPGARLRYTGGSASTNRTFTLSADDSRIGISDPAAVLTLTGEITGIGGLSKTDDGTLQLNADNTYGGATTISGGTLRLGASERIPDGSALAVENSATFNLNNFSETIGSLASSSGTESVVLGSGTLTTGGDGSSTSFHGTISGLGGVTKTGAGVFIMSTSNTYTGLTTISGGAIRTAFIGNNGTNSPIGRGNLAFTNGGTLEYWGAGSATNRTISLGAGGGTISIEALSVVEMNGVVSGSGSFTKAGTGIINLNVANTYTGGTIINGGALYATNISGSATGSGDITINSGSLYIGDGGTAGAVTGNISNNNGGVLFNRSDDTTYAGQISGTGSVRKYGNGTLKLTGHSTYNGNTDVSIGTLSITDGGSVTNSHHAYIGYNGAIATANVGGGSSNSSWINSGNVYVGSNFDGYSTLNIIGGGSVACANGYVVFVSGLYSYTNGEVNVGGGIGNSTWTLSEDLYVGGNGEFPAYVTITGGGSVSNTVSHIGYLGSGAVIVGGGTGNSVWTNTDALVLGSDDYAGYLEIYTGGLVSAAALDRGFQSSVVYLDGGTLRITANDDASSEIVLAPGGGTIDVPTAGTTFAIDAIYGDGALGSLTKEGAGTLAINFANPYSGTTINGGTVSVNVPIDPSGGIGNGPVTVNSGGTLAGSGFITGSVANSGIVAPGASVGTLSIGSLVQDTSGKLQIELASVASYDQLNVAGSITLAGTLEVLLSGGYAPAAGAVFDILDFASRTGTFDMLTLPSLDPSLVWDASQLYVSGVLSVALAGDYNGDDVVDAADYIVWRKNGGTQDGYDTWRANFGRVSFGPCGGEACVGSSASQDPMITSPGPRAVVPEPSTFALAAAALGCAAVARRRRRDPDCLARFLSWQLDQRTPLQ